MDLNKILAFARKRKLELRKLRLDVERQHRKDANDYRRTYRAISDFLEEGEDLLRSLGDTSEFDKVDKEIKANEERLKAKRQQSKK